MYSSRPPCTKCSQFSDVCERSTTFFLGLLSKKGRNCHIPFLYTSNFFFYISLKKSWVVYELYKNTFLTSDISMRLNTNDVAIVK